MTFPALNREDVLHGKATQKEAAAPVCRRQWLREFALFYGMGSITRFSEEDLNGVSLVKVLEALARPISIRCEKCEGAGSECIIESLVGDDESIRVLVHFVSNEVKVEIKKQKSSRSIAVTLSMQHDPKALGRVVEPYDAKCIGAPFKVILLDGFNRDVNPQTGKTTMEIEDLPGLIAAIVRSRVMHPKKLTGDDLKFIRSMLYVKSSKIASSLDLTSEHYSRCENSSKTMSVSTEKLYRMFVFVSVATRNKLIAESLKGDINHNDLSPEEAKKAVDAFRKIFHEMRIDIVQEAGSDLCITFCRRCGADLIPRGCGDDGKWHDQPDRAA